MLIVENFEETVNFISPLELSKIPADQKMTANKNN